MHVFRRVTAAIGLALMSLGAATAANAVQVTDDRGQMVSFSQAPQRIVSLLPSLTETICALGNCRALVAVDQYSNYPASVQPLATVGGGLDPNIEAILALRPDVVLMATSARAGERLRALGVQVLAFEPKTHADLRRVTEQLGRMLMLKDPGQLWARMEAELLQVVQSLPSLTRDMRVYFEVNSGPFAASESSFIGETLACLGAKNIVSGSLGAFPQINPEFVVLANPDVILVGDVHSRGLETRPGWHGMRAIREKRVCFFTAEESDVLVRPGPRIPQAARIMAQCLLAHATH
jgi:iron complex transport system substrate-binding protein